MKFIVGANPFRSLDAFVIDQFNLCSCDVTSLASLTHTHVLISNTGHCVVLQG